MKENVAITIQHELPCNLPGIRTTIPYTQQRLSFAHRNEATVGRRRSQPSAEKVPVRVAGRNRWRLEIQNTYTAVPGSRIPDTYVAIFIACSSGEMGVPGERTSRTSLQTFEQSPEKLRVDGDLP